MIILFLSCLQGVQTQSSSTQLQEDCEQTCTQYRSVCTQEQSCENLCLTITAQIEVRGCTNQAQNLWSCQQEGEWECVEGIPTFVGDLCSGQEAAYLECIAPEDTGSLSN